ncbi:MAG TPA: bifunctional diguanylate cyclase/phosphodiesterase [Sphingomicrobium sp.]|nr:bifunctional diguanylate cyclase/phosphodiesterase [Sphingomicrobium sp.]
MIWRKHSSARRTASASLSSARRDAFVLGILIAAVCLLIWNFTSFFQELSVADQRLGAGIQVASTALMLNVALILFGWRRYIDLRHEAEKRLESEERAALTASTDALTGLLNRKGFADRMEILCAKASGAAARIVFTSLQVNRLKAVSDRHGYEVGDKLRRLIADAIVDCCDNQSLVARLSGDEFAVAFALPMERLIEAEQASEAILHGVTRPFEIDGKMLQVGAFAGLAHCDAANVRVADLLRRADIAADHATNGRVGRPIWFDDAMERALLVHTEIEQGIRYGLEQQQFVPFFEPQVDLTTGKIVGFEVLARWKHPLSGLIGPDVFIPIAEEIGAIGRLSEQVFQSALLDARDWDPSIKISVNISPQQLTDGWLAERIVRLLTETGFPAERLVVEVTETSLFADIDLARSIASSLKNQGIRLALDDFGTGFSSLAHLRSLPFDMIKIDRSFVTNIHANKESAAIVRAVTTLASALNVPVCVEGIESEAANQAVLALGCTTGQGWYFGKPMPAEQAAQLLARPSAAFPAAARRAAG